MRKVLPDNMRHLGLLLVAVLFFFSCDRYADVEKYQRPEWLVGKIFTQMSTVPEMSMFTQCVSDVEYDEILDKSGTYAVFVPVDSVFSIYLQEHSYNSVEDIPYDEKLRLVKSHILQMPWAEDQLKSLSSRGWISLDDASNNKPMAFKRQTIMRNPNKTYPVKVETINGKDYAIIVPEDQSTSERVVYSNSRKYAPLYFDEFLVASELSGIDYSFYFDRPYEAGNIYYMNAKVDKDELFADNGFIYAIDKVAEPLLNAEELMEELGHSTFLDLIHQNSSFEYNEDQTLLQEGADEGEEVDELFDLTYPGIAFSIHNEIITSSRYTLEYHNGIIVPDNNALETFINEELIGGDKWGAYEDIPVGIKRVLLNSHMVQEPIYKTDIDEGFYNSLGDLVALDESTITKKILGSNATYIATNKVVKPKAFSSVCNPLYTSPKYQAFLSLYDKVNILSLLKDSRIDYSFFIIDDASIGETPGDESLIQEWRSTLKYFYSLKTFDQSDFSYIELEDEEYEEMAFGQVGIQSVKGEATKEYVETLDGRHIILDNINKTMTGGQASKFGYNGTVDVEVNFSPIDVYDNGTSYLTNSWLNFSSTLTYTHVKNRPKYLNLLKKAGLADDYSLTFISPELRYTLLVPTDSVIDAEQLESLPKDSLRELLSHHILNDELMFTDGRQEAGEYETLNEDRKLTINPQPDVLHITQEGGVIYDLKLDDGSTNIIGTKDGPDNYPITETVIHEIKTVLR